MSYLFISGRTIDQAKGMHVGKMSDFYNQAVSVMEMSAADAKREGIMDGERVTVTSEWGAASCRVKISDIPDGMVFVPLGPIANAVSGVDTEGTGMPLFKGFTVELEREKNHDTGD